MDRRGSKPGALSWNWKGRDVTYRSAHERVWRLWGKASGHPCIHCGSTAQEWAYDGTDPLEKTHYRKGLYKMKYSPYPEYYYPACIPCHRAADERVSHCVNGHAMTPENSYSPPTRPNRRQCKTCISKRARAHYLKRIGKS